ncbi:hypothetical protein GCM10023322_71290 [Rugosimonospora acidiphila]|uniref:Uncharacterized protein n=1 Tax=Rugosimonospora acidiphila TaxID=556531 RepID=A0ABP9SPD1_9ACTN
MRLPGDGLVQQGAQPAQLGATADQDGADQLTIHAETVRCGEALDHRTIGSTVAQPAPIAAASITATGTGGATASNAAARGYLRRR